MTTAPMADDLRAQIRRWWRLRRLRQLRRMAATAPVSAWAASFDTPEELRAAMEAGENPRHLNARLDKLERDLRGGP